MTDAIAAQLACAAYDPYRPRPRASHLFRLMAQRSPLLAQRSGQVAFVCAKLATAAGLPQAQEQALVLAAQLHDIGRLIQRPDTSEAEHPVLGEWLCMAAGLPSDVQLAVRHHHERMDGTGYPDGLAGTAIPRLARFIAVADAYVDLAVGAPWQLHPTHPSLRRELHRRRGTDLDPSLVDLLLSRCSGTLR